MREIPNVVVVIARCRTSGSGNIFGIRVEEKGQSQWIADWAFPIQEKKASKEGYANSRICGSFGIDPALYPGCPYCHAPGFLKCGCGKIACWDGESRVVTCPWCGAKGELGGAIESLNAGNDR
jgi:hypothetical protein